MENNGIISAYLYLFGAWLTQRPTPVGPFSAKHDSAQMAELVDTFIKHKKLDDPDFEAINSREVNGYLNKNIRKQVDEYKIKQAFMKPYKDLQKALDDAVLEIKNRGDIPKIVILPSGSLTVPFISNC